MSNNRTLATSPFIINFENDKSEKRKKGNKRKKREGEKDGHKHNLMD